MPSEIFTDTPNIIHLNGVAGILKRSRELTSFHRKIEHDERYERLNEFVRIYTHIKNDYQIEDLFSFSWELIEAGHNRILQSQRIFVSTQILVVIGYSFPFFNREVDKKLFSSFIEGRNTDQLKVYIQDPFISEDQINFLRQRFNIPPELKIEPITFVNQFFLPPEL